MDAKETGVVSKATRDRAFEVLQGLLAELRRAGAPSAEPPYDAMVDVVESIRSEIAELPSILVSWTVFSSADDYEYVHAFDVAVFSVAVALAMGERARVVDVGLGALMHDVGLALVPGAERYLGDVGLSGPDLEQVRAHPELGVRVLRQHPRISAFTKAIVAQHHERMDGSGYPRGLRGSEIHLYPRIVACADVYSSMLVQSHLEHRMTPGEVVDYLMSAAGFEYDKDVVRIMLSCVSPFPEGALVRLSAGELAVVERLSKGLLTRPVVRLVRDSGGAEVEEAREIDLSSPEHQTTLITCVV